MRNREAARVLIDKERALVLVGQLALRHPRCAAIRRLAAALTDFNRSAARLPTGGCQRGGCCARGCTSTSWPRR